MEWLFANPIGDLSGPAFLALYALIAAAIVVAARLQIAAADTSETGPPPPVTTDRDPYEIAYLRGGGNELLRFTIFDLARQGALRVADPPKPGKPPEGVVATGSSGEQPSTLARDVVAFYREPHTTSQLFASDLPAAAKTFGAAAFDAALRAQRFLAGPEVGQTATRFRTYGALALIALAVYRLANAFVKHHSNVILLIIEAAFALLALALATRTPRVSRHGRAYLTRLATAVAPTAAAPLAAGIGILPLLVATTGLGALAGTEYGPFGSLFPKKATADSSSCSGGCGSASSGGGGGGDSSSSCGGGGGCGG